MAPIRRYLRITKYSVLEVRIYLQKPSDVAWLLSSRDPVLPRVMQAVRPIVLPKLREENELAKKKGGKKKKAIKDAVSQDDFEVAIFLKETSTRHSLLTKHKSFADKPRIQSTGSKLTGWLQNSEKEPMVLQEDDDEVPDLNEIPEVATGSKRKQPAADAADQDDEALFISSSDEETFATQRAAPRKRRRRNVDADEDEQPVAEKNDDDDDKKKLAINTVYDGFSIYGRVLCLIVTRKGTKKDDRATQTLREYLEVED